MKHKLDFLRPFGFTIHNREQSAFLVIGDTEIAVLWHLTEHAEVYEVLTSDADVWDCRTEQEVLRAIAKDLYAASRHLKQVVSYSGSRQQMKDIEMILSTADQIDKTLKSEHGYGYNPNT